MKKSALIVDAIALVVYLLAANPSITGIPLHEWLGLGIVVVLLIHCIMHYDWFARAFKGSFKQPTLALTGRLALNVLTAISFVVCVVSGLLISGTVLPMLGLYADGYYFWNPLHSFSAKLLLALIIVHLVLHASQMWAYFKKKK